MLPTRKILSVVPLPFLNIIYLFWLSSSILLSTKFLNSFFTIQILLSNIRLLVMNFLLYLVSFDFNCSIFLLAFFSLFFMIYFSPSLPETFQVLPLFFSEMSYLMHHLNIFTYNFLHRLDDYLVFFLSISIF